MLYQLSTFVAALAQALSSKGYTVTDANLNALAAALAAIMTQADMVPYAPLASPALSGTPTTPTPPAGDSSAAIANTSWVAASFATLAWVLANFAPLNSPQFQGTPGTTTPAAGDSSGRIPNTIWVAQNFAPQTNPGFNGQVNINGTAVINAPPNGDNSNRVTNTQWVTTNFAQLAQFPNSLSQNGYQKLPGGLLIQWGTVAVPNSGSITVNFPVPFSANPFCIQATDNGTAGNNSDYIVSAGLVPANPTTQFTIYVKNQSGSYIGASVGWLAIGH